MAITAVRHLALERAVEISVDFDVDTDAVMDPADVNIRATYNGVNASE